MCLRLSYHISYIHLKYIETKLLTFVVLFSCLIHFFALAVFTCEYFVSQTIIIVTLLVMVIFSQCLLYPWYSKSYYVISRRSEWVKLSIKLPVYLTILANRIFMHIFFHALFTYEPHMVQQLVVSQNCLMVHRYWKFKAVLNIASQFCLKLLKYVYILFPYKDFL